jgi:hypothetical protein
MGERRAGIVRGIPYDGDGIIIVGGHVIHVTPRGPAYKILEQLAASLAVGSIADIAAQAGLRRAALTSIARSTLVQLDQLEPPRGMEEPQTSSATSTISRSFAISWSTERSFPSNVDEKPHCGDRQSCSMSA